MPCTARHSGSSPPHRARTSVPTSPHGTSGVHVPVWGRFPASRTASRNDPHGRADLHTVASASAVDGTVISRGRKEREHPPIPRRRWEPHSPLTPRHDRSLGHAAGGIPAARSRIGSQSGRDVIRSIAALRRWRHSPPRIPRPAARHPVTGGERRRIDATPPHRPWAPQPVDRDGAPVATRHRMGVTGPCATRHTPSVTVASWHHDHPISGGHRRPPDGERRCDRDHRIAVSSRRYRRISCVSYRQYCRGATREKLSVTGVRRPEAARTPVPKRAA